MATVENSKANICVLNYAARQMRFTHEFTSASMILTILTIETLLKKSMKFARMITLCSATHPRILLWEHSATQSHPVHGRNQQSPTC